MDSAWEVANDTVALTTPRLRGVRRCVAKVATGANKSHQGLGCKPGPMFYSGCWYCDKMLCGIVVCTPCGHALHESCWLVSGRSSLGNAHCKVCGKQFSDVIRVHNMYPSGGTKVMCPAVIILLGVLKNKLLPVLTDSSFVSAIFGVFCSSPPNCRYFW